MQNKYKPIISHDMHQQGGGGSRIFVPPFTEPFDPNMHPLLRMQQNTVGQAMAHALLSEGKEGVAWEDSYDMWSPARQYMVYHGQPRILTEIASSNLADPVKTAERPAARPAGIARELPGAVLEGHVDARPAGGLRRHRRARRHDRTSRSTAASGCYNFYRVHRDLVDRQGRPYAFVVSADQRDPFGTYEMLDILKFGDVEIHRATAAFSANGKQYPAGSFVIKTAQPYGGFAKTMLSKQEYPDLRLFPGRSARAALRRDRPHAVDADRRHRGCGRRSRSRRRSSS